MLGNLNMLQRKRQLADASLKITWILKLSDSIYTAAIVNMLQQVNTQKINVKIKNLSIDIICKKEPNECFRTKKYNN